MRLDLVMRFMEHVLQLCKPSMCFGCFKIVVSHLFLKR